MGTQRKTEAASTSELSADDLDVLTKQATEFVNTAEFAGFLTKEDSEAVYIADQQGTWVIRRSDIVFLEDWADWRSVPNHFAASGKPVRIGVADGATIHEIRPWKIEESSNAPL